MNIALLNDSFYPCIDGVANVVMNYASQLQNQNRAVVITPQYPGAADSFPFEVIRYGSFDIAPRTGYRVGFPFGFSALRAYHRHTFDIAHAHCPFSSGYLARFMRKRFHIPVVFTYHTKYDIDLEAYSASDTMIYCVKRLILSNIEACDDVWVVSAGAGVNLELMGYQGAYSVMPNGVDIPKKRADGASVHKLTEAMEIPRDTPVFLFVGRLRWYKGVRLVLDGMRKAKTAGLAFKTVFVGDGADKEDMIAYADRLGLKREAIFVGSVQDRALLTAYYSLATLLLFPSAYDTNGLVVREAAACSLPSLLLKGSCAAEGVVDGHNGLVISASAEEIATRLDLACKYPDAMRRIGENAASELYISWESAVNSAYRRYQELVDTGKGRPTRLRAGMSL
jgi:1,2-diacylglycerol 3-alpha-glucosyltransferase